MSPSSRYEGLRPEKPAINAFKIPILCSVVGSSLSDVQVPSYADDNSIPNFAWTRRRWVKKTAERSWTTVESLTDNNARCRSVSPSRGPNNWRAGFKLRFVHASCRDSRQRRLQRLQHAVGCRSPRWNKLNKRLKLKKTNQFYSHAVVQVIQVESIIQERRLTDEVQYFDSVKLWIISNDYVEVICGLCIWA